MMSVICVVLRYNNRLKIKEKVRKFLKCLNRIISLIDDWKYKFIDYPKDLECSICSSYLKDPVIHSKCANKNLLKIDRE